MQDASLTSDLHHFFLHENKKTSKIGMKATYRERYMKSASKVDSQDVADEVQT